MRAWQPSHGVVDSTTDFDGSGRTIVEFLISAVTRTAVPSTSAPNRHPKLECSEDVAPKASSRGYGNFFYGGKQHAFNNHVGALF